MYAPRIGFAPSLAASAARTPPRVTIAAAASIRHSRRVYIGHPHSAATEPRRHDHEGTRRQSLYKGEFQPLRLHAAKRDRVAQRIDGRDAVLPIGARRPGEDVAG